MVDMLPRPGAEDLDSENNTIKCRNFTIDDEQNESVTLAKC